MSTSTASPSGVSSAGADPEVTASLDRLWPELPRLRQAALADSLVAQFVDHVGALRSLLHDGPDRPLLAGLVGGASCGKSTVFSSLVGRPLSRIHYQPHSSLGPILYLHRSHHARWFAEPGQRRFLPQFELDELRGQEGPVVGAVDRIVLAVHNDDRWRHLAILDLPDISSESARREGWLVRHILPWLDLVVWMVDPNDYLFEDLYLDPIEEVRALGQRSVVVVNDIHGQVQRDNLVLAERVNRFAPDTWFVLPRLNCTAKDPYPLFRVEGEFRRLRDYLEQYRTYRPVAPLLARVRHDASRLLHANSEWVRRMRELSTRANRLVTRHRRRILASAPLLSVLPGAAQAELERLRSRFSLFHQGRRLYRAIRSPARTVGQAAFRQLQLSVEDLDTEPLYRHLIGTLKEFAVDLHRCYLESRLVSEMFRQDPNFQVLGSFDPESLQFKGQLDRVARHLFLGAQQMLSDPSLLKDKRFQFVLGTAGVAVVFLAAETALGFTGISLLVGKGLTGLAAVLSPELARLLPLDRMSRLAVEAREMLASIVDEQMKTIVSHFTAPHDRYLAPEDRLIPLLEAVLGQEK